jgi:hypothetical protein
MFFIKPGIPFALLDEANPLATVHEGRRQTIGTTANRDLYFSLASTGATRGQPIHSWMRANRRRMILAA